MPLQDGNDPNDYVRVKRVYVDSADRVIDADLNTFRVELDEEVRNAVGIELTGYSIPNKAAPSFLRSIPGSPGDSKIDFFITNNDPGDLGYGITSQLVAEMTEERYVYENDDAQTRSYTHQLKRALDEAIEGDPYWGSSNIFVTVFEDKYGRTDLQMRWAGVDILWGFNFATGPNSDNTPYVQMGFDRQDYVTTRRLTSPRPTNLRLYRYITFAVEEFRELNPVARVYIEDGDDKNYVSNEINTARTRLVSSDRLHRVRHLTITPLLNGSKHVPGLALLDLEFTIFHKSNQGEKPRWFKERFTV